MLQCKYELLYLSIFKYFGAGDDNDSTMIQEDNADRTRGDENKSREDDDETQIDENEGEGEGDGERSGIFAGKKFVVLGFPPEQEHELCEMIPSQAGKVLHPSSQGEKDSERIVGILMLSIGTLLVFYIIKLMFLLFSISVCCPLKYCSYE